MQSCVCEHSGMEYGVLESHPHYLNETQLTAHKGTLLARHNHPCIPLCQHLVQKHFCEPLQNLGLFGITTSLAIKDVSNYYLAWSSSLYYYYWEFDSLFLTDRKRVVWECTVCAVDVMFKPVADSLSTPATDSILLIR